MWHVFVRSEDDRTEELVTSHDDGFDTFATEPAGSIGVDSGTAGVFDKKCPKRDGDTPLEEGTFAALGAFASTGWGDGMYPVYVGSAAKPYSASAKFAPGDMHVKLGAGSVIRFRGDGKIDGRLSHATRTLVHARK